jgi:hypothetical protein
VFTAGSWFYGGWGASYTVAGIAEPVDQFVSGRPVLRRERIGGLASVTVEGPLPEPDAAPAAGTGLGISAVPPQQLVVSLTTQPGPALTAVVSAKTGAPVVITGCLQALYGTSFATTIVVTAGMYPFSFVLALGRRDYVLGALVLFGGFSLVATAVCTVLGQLE